MSGIRTLCMNPLKSGISIFTWCLALTIRASAQFSHSATLSATVNFDAGRKELANTPDNGCYGLNATGFRGERR